MRPRAAALAFVLVLAFRAGGWAVASEIVFGGEAGIRSVLTVSPRLDQLVELLLRSEYTAIVAVHGDAVRLSAAATVWHQTPVTGSDAPHEHGVLLDEVRLSIASGDRLTFDVGRFPHAGGRAMIASPNDPFAAASFDRLLRGDLSGSATPQTLAIARVFMRYGYAALTLMPVPKVPQLLASGSIWIPAMPLDRTIDDTELSDEPVTLGEIFAESTRSIEEPYRRISGGVEAGFTAGPVDLSLVYYHGIDPNPVPRARISFPLVPPLTYDLSFAPEEVVIDSFGLIAESAFGSATFWIDAAYVPNRTLATTQIDRYSKRTRLIGAPTIRGVAGASYRVQDLNLLLLAEYHHTHSFLPVGVPAESVVRTPLVSDLVVAAQVSAGAEQTWKLSAGGIVSLDDASGIVLVSLDRESWSGLAVSLSVPVFVGAASTSYGQYGDIFNVAATLRYGF